MDRRKADPSPPERAENELDGMDGLEGAQLAKRWSDGCLPSVCLKESRPIVQSSGTLW